MPEPALILLYSRHTRNSVNALVGAIETGEAFASVEVRLPRDAAALEADMAETVGQGQTVVGISLFTFQFRQAGDLVRRIRRQCGSEALLMTGGPHPSADPLGVLQLGFDLVVCGEGEQTIRDLLAALRDGRDWRTIRGIAFLDALGPVVRSRPIGSGGERETMCAGEENRADDEDHRPQQPRAGGVSLIVL